MKIYKFRNCGEITIDSLEKMKHKNLKYVNICTQFYIKMDANNYKHINGKIF
jgi:hypothetical protein